MYSRGQPSEILIAGADHDSMMIRMLFMQLDEISTIKSQDSTSVIDRQTKHGFIANPPTGVAGFVNGSNVVA